MKVEEGVMLMKDGKGWGIVYQDGHSTSYGWVEPEDAPLHKAEYCKLPTDITYKESPYINEISKGKLIKVVRRTVVEILD